MSINTYQRSFGRIKSRKLRDGNVRLLDEILPRVRFEEGFVKSFEEIWLEIGFGGGEHLLHQALANPQVGIIGCEPFINGTVKLLRGIEENCLKNVRIYPGDFRELITSSCGLTAGTLRKDPAVKPQDDVWMGAIDRAFILFPDPWPKKKHNKRRLVSKETLDILARIMKPGARLRVATDHVDYAKWIVRTFLEHPGFEWQASSKADWQTQPGDHIETKYQKKAGIEGRKPVFFDFNKR